MPNKPGRPKEGNILFARRVQPHLVPLILAFIEEKKIKKGSAIPQPQPDLTPYSRIQSGSDGKPEIAIVIPNTSNKPTVLKPNYFLPRHK